MYRKVGHRSKRVPDPILARTYRHPLTPPVHAGFSCQVRPFSPSPKITRRRLRAAVFACFHLGSIFHLHVRPCLRTHSKSRRFVLTTGRARRRLESWPRLLQAFVFMSFSHDIQSSSCRKPPDPLRCASAMANSSMAAADCGEARRSFLLSFENAELLENQNVFHSGILLFFFVLQRSPGISTEKGLFYLACVAPEKELECVLIIANAVSKKKYFLTAYNIIKVKM